MNMKHLRLAQAMETRMKRFPKAVISLVTLDDDTPNDCLQIGNEYTITETRSGEFDDPHRYVIGVEIMEYSVHTGYTCDYEELETEYSFEHALRFVFTHSFEMEYENAQHDYFESQRFAEEVI
jgi:hypothetical protein